MRTTIKTILLIAVLALLAASCSTDGADEAVAAEPTITVATTTTAEPPPDPAEIAAETQQATIDAFLVKDMEALMATHTEDAVFLDPAFSTRWVGASYESNLQNVFKWTDAEQTELLDSFVSDDGTRGTVIYHWVGTNYNGGPLDLIMVQVHEYKDGKIQTTTNYYGDDNARAQFMDAASS